MNRRVRQGAVLSLLLSLPGCTGWRTENIAPATIMTNRKPSELRVRLADGRRVTLSEPRIHGDTLYGYSTRGGWVSGTVSVPLAEVGAVETRHTDPFKTGLAAAGLGAVVWLTVAAIQISQDPFFK